MMYERLCKFLDLFEILYTLQFGFRESHSTFHALLSLTETIKNQSIMENLAVASFVIFIKLLTQ